MSCFTQVKAGQNNTRSMNIFYLDKEIVSCAQAHFDCHVVKMILESAQILSTVCNLQGLATTYKPTHKNHPCTLWAAESIDNWQWLYTFTLALNDEYCYRFNHQKSHRSIHVINQLQQPDLPTLGITERPQAMPACYHVVQNPVAAYRAYYLGEKKHLMKYTKRKPPKWLITH